ncbi:TIGR02594 family protein [bacterium]|jgi:uncharacterized protein (TIGR02594 family)|nr:TIGR02594 family protein [bacterium]
MLITACAPFASENTTSVDLAQEYIGLGERANRRELHQLTGVDPVRTEWCAAFVNAVLELDNIPNLNNQTKYPPLMARSFLYWGEKVDPEFIQRGDVVIFPRGNSGWKGHVGFFVEEQNGKWVILGGNQNNEVRYDFYNPQRALGVRRYPTQEEAAGSLPKWMMDKY